MKMTKLAIGLFFIFALTGCVRGAIQPTEESTSVQESILLTSTPEIPTLSPSIAIQIDSSSVPMNPVYFDGIVVLTEYYTFLGHGLYEEAVSLFSVSKQEINGTEADIAYFEESLESIEIIAIRPYDYWLVQQGRKPLQNVRDELRFVIETSVIYKGKAWNKGGTPTPYNKTSFISLVLENDEWKIDEVNSSPWFSNP